MPIHTDDAHGAARIKDRRRGTDQALQGAQAKFRSSPASRASTEADRPHHDARPRRLGHQRGGGRGRDAMPTAATSTPTSTASTRPTRASCRRRGGSTRPSFEEMLEMASLGAKVLQVRSVELAMVHKVRLFVRSSFDAPDAPQVDRRWHVPPGTLICDEEEIMENQVVTGIAFSKDEAQISLREVADKPGVAAAIFGPLAEASINVDMIVQNVSEDGKKTDLTFTVPVAEFTTRPRRTIEAAKHGSALPRMEGYGDVAKVSVIGVGMRSHAGVAATAFKALADKGINIRGDHHLRDQDFDPDRRRLYRACGPDFAFGIRTRRLVPPSTE
jgi:aspartate kinase